MARKKSSKAQDIAVSDYRHEAKRKNIPPAGLAAQGRVREAPKMSFAYDPHLPPILRADPRGAADVLPELLEIARTRPLTVDETQLLAEALRQREPWLEWTGKREKKGFEVDPVALHIHERVSAQAILKVAARESVQRSLFADPQQEYREAVQFYQHDVDWANRMILGDSLQVMASLAHREGLAGKVQMIYMDPPYGISFRSNFQPEIGNTNVQEHERDLTREPEMVKAFRDTWTLGVHSYLTYLHDRLCLCKELLTDTGSIFVQISDENLHSIRTILDEVFGPRNFIVLLTFTKKGSQSSDFIPPINEYVIWYARDRELALTKFQRLYVNRNPSDAEGFAYCELASGETAILSIVESRRLKPSEYKLFSSNALFSQKSGPNNSVELREQLYPPGGNSWKIAVSRIPVLDKIDRLLFSKNRVRYKRYASDFPAVALSNLWTDLAGTPDKKYVTQTNPKVIERCVLMTTVPGDLVLDPTCGAGTTAYVAEQWGRRWITIDTSRVALALARQRMLTAMFPFYKVKEAEVDTQVHPETGQPHSAPPTDQSANPLQGFIYKTVPHITLKSIAQNVALDPMVDKHQPTLDAKLAALNAALKTVISDLRQQLAAKLQKKERHEGKKAITDADRRRWLLPKEGWKEWEVPFDVDEDWTPELKTALTAYRAVWRAKMDEVNACIAASAEQ
jgi:adenine-specific DNA-methyltransferase